MARVDAVIRQRLDSDVALIRTIADYIIAAAASACARRWCCWPPTPSARAGEGQHELAAVIEFIHTATLLHDDVVDESSLRRGRRTANAEFGNAASVLVGDFLYSRAFQMMVGVGSSRVMEVHGQRHQRDRRGRGAAAAERARRRRPTRTSTCA